MDIKQRLQQAIESLDSGGAPCGDVIETCQVAIAEIERLEKYAQHRPACALMCFRQQSINWVFMPEPPPCSCGLISHDGPTVAGEPSSKLHSGTAWGEDS